MYTKKNNKLKLYVSFDTSDQTTYAKDKNTIVTIMEQMLPESKQVESNSYQEIIYVIPLPKTNNDGERRAFYSRLKSVFLQTREYLPHFTKYEV